MELYDKQFKRIALKIGICILIYLLLFNTFFGFISDAFWEIFKTIFPEALAHDLSEITDGILYLLAFTLPALFYRMIAKGEDALPHNTKKPSYKGITFIIIAIIATNLCCSQLNAIMVSHFDFYDYMMDILAEYKPMDFADFLIALFASALVPAICEELLFRATILRALVPYGKTFAIMSSALLFSLMHHNPIQFFYTAIAGVLLGLVYVKTNSYLCVFLIHFFNNLFSVFQSLIFGNLNEPLASRLYVIIDLLTIIFGFASILYLVLKALRKQTPYDTGSYGMILEEADGYVERKTSYNPTIKFFRSPTVMIFTIICVVEIVGWLFMPINH